MRIVAKNCSVKVAQVQYDDPGKTLCDGSYFFMEKLEGENFYYAKNSLTEETVAGIHREIGKIARELSGIRNTGFGFLGEDTRYDSLYVFVKQMLINLLSDAEKRNVDILYDRPYYLHRLEKDRSAFDDVCQASLVHWDMWEGNVFVKDGHVSGIIDWERALWGEPYMDDRFRMHNRCSSFLEGYGKTSFEENEKKRMRWYDVILYLTMMIEVFYREYEDKGQYFWAREMLEKSLSL
jgi:fructosamine-3-kinase